MEDMTTLVNTVRTFSTDMGMLFGFDKCATLSVRELAVMVLIYLLETSGLSQLTLPISTWVCWKLEVSSVER